MMLFQRRLFLELMGNALTALLLMSSVLLLVSTVRVLHSVEGLSLLVFLKAVPFFLATGLDLLLPMSVLVAVVLTYGRWASDNEIDTLRASGVHPVHLIVPGVVFGLLLSALLLVCLDYAQPYAQRIQRSLTKDVDLSQVLARKLSSGEPEFLNDNTVLSAGSIDEDGLMHDVTIQLSDDEGNPEQTILAKTARAFVDPDLRELSLDLYDFSTTGDRIEGKRTTIIRTLGRDISEFGLGALTTPELLAWLERPGDHRGGFRVPAVATEVSMRLAGSAACLIFVLLGLPVAIRFRRNDRVGAFLVAFLLALFLYYPAVRVSRALSGEGTVNADLAAWSGHVFLLVIAAFVGWRVFRR